MYEFSVYEILEGYKERYYYVVAEYYEPLDTPDTIVRKLLCKVCENGKPKQTKNTPVEIGDIVIVGGSDSIYDTGTYCKVCSIVENNSDVIYNEIEKRI
jgi:hypothetical protein